MASKKKNKTNRESLLSFRIYSRNFVFVYGEARENYGLFFGLNRKSSKAVKRNRIKRVFRELFKNKIGSKITNDKFKNYSYCLISRKGIKFTKEYLNSELNNEIDIIIEKLSKKVIKSS